MYKVLKFKSPRGIEIVFDDFVDNREEYGTYWAEICPAHVRQYRGVLGHRCGDRGESAGICCIKGCENDSDRYVDFDATEVTIEKIDDTEL